MADLRSIQYPGAPNLLQAIQTGANIRGAQERSTLERERHRANVEQLAVENKRIEEDRATKASEQDYNKGLLEVQMGNKFGDVEAAKQGFKRSMSALGMEIPEDYPIDQKTYDRFIKIANEKNPDLQEVMEDMFAKDLGLSVDAFAQRAKGVGADVSAYETGQALEETIAGEQRGLAGQKDLEKFKTGEAIRQKQAEITATTEALKERPPKGKAQTYPGASGLWEKDAKGKWALAVADPKTTNKKVVDKELRELNLADKIFKNVEKEANIKFAKYGKVPDQQRWNPRTLRYEDNPAYKEYPFEEYIAFSNQRVEELRKKAKISDEMIVSLRGGVPSHDPSAIPDILTAPTVPPEVQQGFVDEGLDQQGFKLGEIETDGDFAGEYRVLDQEGNIKGHFKP